MSDIEQSSTSSESESVKSMVHKLPHVSEKSKDRNGSLANSELLPTKKLKSSSSKKKVYSKMQFCTFCFKKVSSKISRHLLNVHKQEERVQEILLLKKRSPQRIKLLQVLANEGNFKHNITVIQSGKGEIVVGRSSELRKKTASNFTACEFCKKWGSKKNMWRHSQTCLLRKEYYSSHLDANGDDEGKKRRVLAVKNGQALVANALFENAEENLNELLRRMRDDEIKEIVLADELIRREAGLRMTALGRKQDQKQDDIYRVSQSARTLGRIVSLARQSKPDITLDRLIEPRNYDLVVDIARLMSTEKDNPALNVGKMIGNLLKKVCQSKYCVALRKGNESAQNDANNFKTLIEAEWNSRVNRAAVRRINREKRTKMPTIPLTEDLIKFREYLLRNIEELCERLKKRPSPQDWVLLVKFTMSRLILFNKRRRAEVRELRVDEYLARPDWNADAGGEMALALSQTDRLLAKR